MTTPAKSSSDLAAAWDSAFRLPDRRELWEYAAKELTLPGTLAQTGLFDVSGSRHFLKPMRGLTSDKVRRVRILAPPRSAKTLIFDVWVPYIVENAPGPLMSVFSQEKLARDHAESRTWPILQSAPNIARIWPRDPDKARSMETIFEHMPVYFRPAILTHLQAKGIRHMHRDERWDWDKGVSAEAEARTNDFQRIGNEKIFDTSQGGEEDSDWATDCADSEWNEWMVPCDACAKLMHLKWSGERPDGTRFGMMWDDLKDDKGRWRVHAAALTARYVCEHCNHAHQDNPATKHRWNNGGDYVVISEPSETVKLFHWCDIINSSFYSLVAQWLNACNAGTNSLTLKLKFWQKRMAQNKSIRSIESDEIHFTRASYEIQPGSPESDVMRVMSCDKQAMGEYWVLIRDWLQDGTSRRVFYGRAYGEGGLDELADRYKLTPNRVVVDANFEGKGDTGVFQMCARRGWIALIGADKDYFVHTITEGKVTKQVRRSYSMPIAQDPGIGTAAQGRGAKAVLFYFAASQMTDCVMDLIRLGRWIEPVVVSPDETEKAYRRQMAGMTKRPVKNQRNQVVMRWERVWEEHALDCSKMQCFIAIGSGRMPDYLVDEIPVAEKG